MIRFFFVLLLLGSSSMSQAAMVGVCTGSNVAAYQGYNCAPDNQQQWVDASLPLPSNSWYMVCPSGNCSQPRYGYYEQWTAELVGQTRKLLICNSSPCPDWSQMQNYWVDFVVPGEPAPPPPPPDPLVCVATDSETACLTRRVNAVISAMQPGTEYDAVAGFGYFSLTMGGVLFSYAFAAGIGNLLRAVREW